MRYLATAALKAKREKGMSRLWRAKTKVILVVVGALGAMPKNLRGQLKEIEISNRVRTL